MTTQEQKYASLERRYTDRFQPSSEVAVQLQHQLQECQLFMAVVLDSLHGQCIVSIATRCPSQ
jgi:hypothetical protein